MMIFPFLIDEVDRRGEHTPEILAASSGAAEDITNIPLESLRWWPDTWQSQCSSESGVWISGVMPVFTLRL
jgi:hypothetical protein